MSTQTNLETILDQFENGDRRYGEDPNFKSAVDSLKMGLGVYAVLDHYIKENNRLREANSKSQNLIKDLTQAVVDQAEKSKELHTVLSVVYDRYIRYGAVNPGLKDRIEKLIKTS